MTAPYQLRFTVEQTQELEWVRKTHPKPHVRVKAAALLKVAQGHSIEEVRRHGLLKPVAWETLNGWITRYQQSGLAEWGVQAGRGHKPATRSKNCSVAIRIWPGLIAPAGGWKACVRPCHRWPG